MHERAPALEGEALPVEGLARERDAFPVARGIVRGLGPAAEPNVQDVDLVVARREAPRERERPRALRRRRRHVRDLDRRAPRARPELERVGIAPGEVRRRERVRVRPRPGRRRVAAADRHRIRLAGDGRLGGRLDDEHHVVRRQEVGPRHGESAVQGLGFRQQEVVREHRGTGAVAREPARERHEEGDDGPDHGGERMRAREALAESHSSQL